VGISQYAYFSLFKKTSGANCDVKNALGWF
jgi:hypothetical protein